MPGSHYNYLSGMQLSYLLPTEAVALQSINAEHIAEELITEETFDDNPMMSNFIHCNYLLSCTECNMCVKGVPTMQRWIN